MTILYLITKSEAGGAQTHVAQLCERFRHTHDIVVCAYPGGWLEDECKRLGVRFVPNPYFSNSLNPVRLFRSVPCVKQIIQEIKPDIVHCHSSAAGFVGRLAVRKKIPTLYTAHGWGFNIGVGMIQKWVSIVAEKIVARYTTQIICVSRFVKDLCLRYRIAPSEICVVVPNGVEQRKLPVRTPGTLSRVIFVGRLTAPKRPLLLVEAYSLLPTAVQERIQVQIVGDGEQMPELRTYIERKQLSGIELCGALSREQIVAMLDASDVFVLLSDWEGLPMTILEAMSCGLPIISSDVGGIREAVDHTNGILLASNTAQTVAQALERLLTDESLRIQMGQASYTRASTDFSVDTMCARIEQIYNDIA